MVRLAVPAGVESMTVGLARRRGDGCDATEMRERGFALSRCGLSPAATNKIAAVWIPTP